MHFHNNRNQSVELFTKFSVSLLVQTLSVLLFIETCLISPVLNDKNIPIPFSRNGREQMRYNDKGDIIFVNPFTESVTKKGVIPPNAGQKQGKSTKRYTDAYFDRLKDQNPNDLDEIDPFYTKDSSSNLKMQDHHYTLGNTSTESQTQCHLSASNPLLPQQINTLLEEKTKLINYVISVDNSTTNPLLVNMSAAYKGNMWTRVSRKQGETILSLAFNYGVLSLMTLTFGVENMNVTLIDKPKGCLGKLSEQEKLGVVMELLMKDFKMAQTISLSEEESICHQVVQASNSYAVFTYRCCRAESDGVTISCYITDKNIWLQILDVILIGMKFIVLFFGPLLAPAGLFSASLDSTRYVIKIKEPLEKTMCVVRGTEKTKVKSKHVIDLTEGNLFKKCRTQLTDLPLDHVIPIKIDQFEIAVDYSKLLVENKVPVGLIPSLVNAIFNCSCKNISPCKECCQKDMFSHLKEMKTPVKWISLWTSLGKLLMVLMLPAIFYLRLIFFYYFEYPEIDYRKHIAKQNSLTLSAHEFKLMQYLLPSHPLCVTIYFLYGITVIVLAYVGLTGDMKRFKRIIFSSFSDLNKISWLKALELICSKIVWPFQKYGIVGCLIAPFYWTLFLPIILLIYFIYLMPLVFITTRMIWYSFKVLKRAIRYKTPNIKHSLSCLKNRFKNCTDLADEQFLLNELLPKRDSVTIKMDRPQHSSLRRDLIRVTAVILVLLTVLGLSLLATECVGFLTEVLTFTLMGIIVNASSVLKYMTLIILVVMYSFDCYSNVYKKYLKLNKSLFSDVKGRMKKKIEEVTSLPAHLQENTGFKACESNEQAEYETPDDISNEQPMHWELNDVIMFIDNEDMPRIPKELFEQVCDIRVAGSPGPVYRSLIEASKKFVMIILFLMFVFLVVLSFGSIYKVSSTNQTLATLAGGFVPFIMRNFMQPSAPDIELGSVSFSSKLDEIIQNFTQIWPMYDLPFRVNDGANESLQTQNSLDKSTQTNDNRNAETQTTGEFDFSPDQEISGYRETTQMPVTKIWIGDDKLTVGIENVYDQSNNDVMMNSKAPDIVTFERGVEKQNKRQRHTKYTKSTQKEGTLGSHFEASTENCLKSQILETIREENQNKLTLMRNSIVPELETKRELKQEQEKRTQIANRFKSAVGQEVDLLVIIPEGGDTAWCRVWSNMSLYDWEEVGESEGEEEGEDSENENSLNDKYFDQDQTQIKVIDF